MNKIFFNPKTVLKQILKYCLIIISGIFIGYFFLLVVYALPLEKMKEHAGQSVDILIKEGDYPKWAGSMSFTQGDQFIDSIMIKTAVIDTDLELSNKALLLPYIDSRPEVSSLINTVGNGIIRDYETYARYWGGYLIILKPLLLFFTIYEIRVLSFFSLGILSYIAVKLIRDRLGNFFSFALFITILFLNPISIVLSMQYKNIFYISLLTTILILLLEKKKIEDQPGYIFLVDGICVAFFDFLTYPILALCLPLAIYSLLHKESIKNMLIRIIKRSLLWLTGYVSMWAGKWVIASILTDENVIEDGIKRVFYRASANVNGTEIRFSEIIDQEFRLFDYPVFQFIGLSIILVIFFYCLRKRNLNLSSCCIPFLIISVFPFLWYAFVRNHSFIHTPLVYRALGGTLFGILCFIGILVNADECT